MAFRTDGSSHHEGVKNEKVLCEILNTDRELAEAFVPDLHDGVEYSVEQIGGTTGKTDLRMSLGLPPQTKNISVKRKKGTSVGSYDYVNSTSPISSNPNFAALRALCKSFKCGFQPETEVIESARSQVTEALTAQRSKLTSKELINILVAHVIEAYDEIDLILVNDVVAHNLYGFAPSALPFFKYMRGQHREAFIRENGKKSGTVIFKDIDGAEYDFGIRLRFETNNGIQAMFGGRPKPKNNSSSPTIKIQQDNVKRMLESIHDDDLTVWDFKG